MTPDVQTYFSLNLAEIHQFNINAVIQISSFWFNVFYTYQVRWHNSKIVFFRLGQFQNVEFNKISSLNVSTIAITSLYFENKKFKWE